MARALTWPELLAYPQLSIVSVYFNDAPLKGGDPS